MGCATAPCVKAIVGNATMMKAYSDGIPANGKSVRDGAVIAKIEWAKSSNAASPHAVNVPGALNDISFMVKDAKRFPDTDGWGYAQFRYNTASGAFTPYGSGPAFAKKDCHQCHINGAKARDFVYTAYAKR
jgi:acyl CoA:acetate/3-ketoacid CoA transferase